MSTKKDKPSFLLECERWWIFALMICLGGFYGAYTYICKGGVFCNAQTANFVMLGIAVGSADWKTALYYLIPMASYFSGTIISEFLPKKVNKHIKIRWDTAFIAFEMVIVLILALIPDTAPVQICHIMVNFMCSMQYNTFRNAEKIPTATTFCTAHVRSAGVYFVKWLRHKDDKSLIKRSGFHVGLILLFILGAISASLLSGIFGSKSILFAEILLIIAFIDLLHADLTKEKDMLDVVPHGH